MVTLDDRHVAAAVLASLPLITPPRLRRLLETFGSPAAAVDAIKKRRVTGCIGRSSEVDATELASAWRAFVAAPPTPALLAARGAHVWIAGDDDYPITEPLANVPPVLFGEGARPDALDAPCVAIVGTRSATPHGLADARELGAFLAQSGVTVVSGLALGIDSAAHEGALDAGGLAVGVVATGLDVTYPRRHRALFDRVREQGVIVGEHGYGVPPTRDRFPVRNRIIAALSRCTVVVEATASGGARITANYALEYGRDVYAMPGSRRNRAAAGCNALIADGAIALLDPGDLLVGLGRGGSRPGDWADADTAEPADADEAAVWRALGGEAASIDELERSSRLGPARLDAALCRLERAGRVERRHGAWWPS